MDMKPLRDAGAAFQGVKYVIKVISLQKAGTYLRIAKNNAKSSWRNTGA